MSLERMFVICINGPFCFVLSLLAALSLLFLSSSFACRLRKQKR